MNMRLAVLDVGSNTVHLLVVDAHLGAHPWPAHSVKAGLRLIEQIGKDGRLVKAGADSLVTSVLSARDAAAKLDTEDLLAFATSAVRDAKNSAEVLARVRKETGVELRVLSGEGEARMTFLAVRRWYGWSAGNLLVLDIGGGSLEIGVGIDEEPARALSLPLGAGRMTRQFLNGDPPRARDIDADRVRGGRTGPGAEVGRHHRLGQGGGDFQDIPHARPAGRVRAVGGRDTGAAAAHPDRPAPTPRIHPAHPERRPRGDGRRRLRAGRATVGRWDRGGSGDESV
jgi:hypothetical protein